jgi:Tol biopolymer transport system component
LPGDTPNGAAERDANGRLDSWKEIAAYLRRDVKTVQRWERREGLPVHRLHHHSLSSVYAYRTELDAWIERRRVSARAGREEGNGESENLPPINGAESEALGALPPLSAQRAWRGSPWLAALGALLTITAIGWASVRITGSLKTTNAPMRFDIGPPAGTRFAGNTSDPDPVVSPDGTRLVFRATVIDSGRQRLYLRELDQPVARPIEGTDQAVQPFWSPDSQQIGFFSDGELKRIDLTTGRVAVLAAASRPTGGAWLSSGDIVFGADSVEGIQMLEAGSGVPIAVTKVDRSAGQQRHLAPEAAPDGRRFVYLAEYRDPRSNAVWMWTGKASADRHLLNARRMGRFTQGNWFLFFRGQRLIAQRVDLDSTTPMGAAVELPEALDEQDGNARRAGFSVSPSGTLAYWPVTGTPLTRLTWFDRHGAAGEVVGPLGEFPFVALSPGADRVAVQRVDRSSGAPDVWVYDLSTGVATQLTDSPANDEDPVWSPDGTQIVYARHPDLGTPSGLALVDPREPLIHEPVAPAMEGHPTDWSRDGRTIIVQQANRDTQSDVAAWTMPHGPMRPLVNSPFNERHGRLSPDGRYLAYTSDESGRFEVYVKSLEHPGPATRVSEAGGAHPRWRGDGGEIYYLSPVGMVTAVRISPGPRLSTGQAVPLFDARLPLPLAYLDTLYDVTADGQRFLVAAAERPDSTSFTVVVNALIALSR